MKKYSKLHAIDPSTLNFCYTYRVDKLYHEMSTFDKVLNIGFTILFTIMMSLAVVGHIIMEMKGLNEPVVFYVW